MWVAIGGGQEEACRNNRLDAECFGGRPGIMEKLGMVMKQKNAKSEKILFNYDNGHRNVAMESTAFPSVFRDNGTMGRLCDAGMIVRRADGLMGW